MAFYELGHNRAIVANETTRFVGTGLNWEILMEDLIFPAYAVGVISAEQVATTLRLDSVENVPAHYKGWKDRQSDKTQMALDKATVSLWGLQDATNNSIGS